MKNTSQIDNIKELLPDLSEDALAEVRDFVSFLLDKEQKHNTFVNETLKVKQNSDTITFKSSKDSMETIRSWSK